MKTIRTALGVKRIEDRDQHLALLQLRELLDAHRNVLINRLIGDLPTYLDYKFGTRINQKQLEVLKDKLAFMKNASVDMDKYDFIYQHMLISSAQRIEHYEIAAYGVARTFAEKLDQIAAADLLQETLNEEGMTDQHLTRLALRKINAEAVAV